MASAKALLKDARQCLDTGEFPKAIELCEKVLNDEKDHYMALLLLGAAATAAKGSGAFEDGTVSFGRFSIVSAFKVMSR